MADESVWGPRIDRPEGGWPEGKCPIPWAEAGDYTFLICDAWYTPAAKAAQACSWPHINAYRVRADLHRVQPDETPRQMLARIVTDDLDKTQVSQPAEPDTGDTLAAEYYARGFGLRCRVVDYLNGLESKETLRASFAEWESASGTKFLLPPTAAPKPAAPAETDVVERMAEALRAILEPTSFTWHPDGSVSVRTTKDVLEEASNALAAYEASKGAGR